MGVTSSALRSRRVRLTYWYAPKVRAIVKKLVQSTGMPIYTTELVEFQLQP